MAPVIKAIQGADGLECQVWSTGQHRRMLDQVLDFFGIETDVDLGVMTHDQSLNETFGKIVAGVDQLLARRTPDLLLVHGDTTTAAAAAVAAFHRRIPIAHVEAGLRSGRMDQPWPEEFNRKLVDMVGMRLFSPTEGARQNLIAEGVPPEKILVTGNTVVDALLDAVERISPGTAARGALDTQFAYLDPNKPLVLVTGHRRENFGQGFRDICLALRRLSQDDVQIVYPVHLNPNVLEPVKALLGDAPDVYLIDPVDYPSFVYLMSRASVILTDSGGVQEEAPSLGKPLLVMRNVTERPEAIEAGVAQLVGTDPGRIVASVRNALDQPARPYAINPYGDGFASARIVQELRNVANSLR
ncbi:non-hydrolyzing UDP-N-acetylglucosamine 2-epimerase [Brevundimonas sp.]|uniref:non-hydrolyzing UDP-N-acetylglucosamine 2-epimerase n=1 Tax=Brevundimonas sp. TaxID=1871086 RepID=UPI003BA84374